jgi:hypothetical protein
MSEKISKDFWDAIIRIETNDPGDAELRSICGSNTPKLNISNVAKVSGHSRTHISKVDSEYPDVRKRIFGIADDPVNRHRVTETARATVKGPSQTTIALSNRLAKQEALEQCKIAETKLAEADISVSLLKAKVASLEAKVMRFQEILRKNGIPFPRE